MEMTLEELLELVGDNEELRQKILAKKKREPKFKEGQEVWTVRFELVPDKIAELRRVPHQTTITKVNKNPKRISYKTTCAANAIDEYYIKSTKEEVLALIAELE